METIDDTLNNELPVNIARKVSYTTDTLNTVYVYGSEDSSQNVFQGLEFRTGTETTKRYRIQQESNGYITLYRRKSDDSGWEAVYSGNISLISTLQNNVESLFQIITYSYTYSLAGGAYISVSANNFGKTSPNNYTPVAFTTVTTGNANVLMYLMSANSIGTSAVLALYNLSTSTVNATAKIEVLYMRTYARV